MTPGSQLRHHEALPRLPESVEQGVAQQRPQAFPPVIRVYGHYVQ
ncbi:hypothetical protein P8A21_39670 (plasmid) [Streptomyces poriferorum]|nr:hypothetical protein [Streptomyces sp. Alt1]WLQ53671.1 hypothetical protein P8A21_39670 [Streptomyces sp. Alt1]